MRRGDRVVIIESDGEFFDVGDTGKLLRKDAEEPGCWWVDFNGFDNVEVSGNGEWCVSEYEMQLAFDEDPEEVLP